MKPATLEFVKQRFADYYRRCNLIAPSSLEQREWGFVFFDAAPELRMRRHMAFADREELNAYVKNLVPAHVYYSTAYYQTPSAPKMSEKHWAGADLIFDLDADQIVRGPYAMMLARVKEETLKLIEMLTEELGFSRNRMRIVFSGGRGYHIHITDIAVLGWGSQERREIVDYVCGIGLDPEMMLSSGGEPRGWRRRYTETLRGCLSHLAALDPAEATARLTGLEGIGKRTAAQFLADAGALSRAPAEELLQNRVVRAITASPEFEKRLRDAGAHADEPVTTDIKRLIRTPGSLHGGSGMRVVPLDLHDLEDFDPLVDAVVFGERDIRVDVKANFVASMLGNTYTLKAGTQTVPEALAIYLCCRNTAEIAGGWMMVADILEKLRQMLLDMQHSGRLSHIEPRLYENARAYIEKLKEDYYSLENPLENREGGLIIEAIGSVNDTVQEIFSIRTRQILDLAFQQIEGEYVDKEETRKMLPEERAMFKQIVEAIEECRKALIQGEVNLFSGEEVAAVEVTDEVGYEKIEPSAVPSPPAPRTPGLTAYALVHVRSDVESFMGLDGRTYVLEEGDIITLPEKNAELLCEHNIGLNIRLNK